MTTKTLTAALLTTLLAASPAAAGDGTFTGDEEIAIRTPTSVVVGDFNGDGRPDLAAIEVVSGDADVFLRKPGGSYRFSSSIGLAATHLAVADVDADGRDDLVAAEPNQLQVCRGNGTGAFVACKPFPLPGETRSLVTGDFNGDAKVDLAVAAVRTGNPFLALRLGDGKGDFAATPSVPGGFTTLAVGDLDGNAREDLVFGALPGGMPGTLRGTGTGAFVPGSALPVGGAANTAQGLVVADFNGDGRQDVAASIHERDVVAVRFGTGDGGFAGGPDVPVADDPAGLAAGDLDADGDDDLVIAAHYENAVRVHLNDGTGAFGPTVAVPVGIAPTEVVLADLNGDGNDDLVTGEDSNSLSIRYGAGTPGQRGNLLVNGGFEGVTAAGTPAFSPPIPGWDRTGGMTFARYGMTSSLFFPTRREAPRFGTGQGSLLWGGASAATGGVTTATQQVDVAASARVIDDRRVTARLSAWLGGAADVTDRMGVSAAFLAADGSGLGSVDLLAVSAADRRNVTRLLRRANSAEVPPGTRAIRVTLTSTDDDRTFSSAVADNVRLALETGAEPVTGDAPRPADPQQEPRADVDDDGGTPPATFGPRTRVTVTRLRGRRVRVVNRNPFAVTGTVRLGAGRRLGRARSFRIAASARTTLVLAPVRGRGKPRVRAVVSDPAGTRRTVRVR